MMRRSRILTLFPYTTLFRSHEDDVGRAERLLVEQRELAHLPGDLEDVQVALEAHHAGRAERALERAPGLRRDAEGQAVRSEEHTSELQSPCNLVCRLLLENK